MRSDQRNAIRAVALFEAFKALLALCAASGLLLLLHRDLNDYAVRLVAHAHLNPAARYPRIFLDAAAHADDSRLVLLALGALAYMLLRAAEAYGLWFERAWAEVLAAASAGLYIPFEVLEFARHPNALGAAIVAVNVAVVVVMLRALHARRRAKRAAALS
jgi:uncharacterized membrane protein (DUF2068 family)